MIIINLELGEELEREFYRKLKNENISYIKYVEELIINDLRKSNLDNLSETMYELEEIKDDKKVELN